MIEIARAIHLVRLPLQKFLQVLPDQRFFIDYEYPRCLGRLSYSLHLWTSCVVSPSTSKGNLMLTLVPAAGRLVRATLPP